VLLGRASLRSTHVRAHPEQGRAGSGLRVGRSRAESGGSSRGHLAGDFCLLQAKGGVGLLQGGGIDGATGLLAGGIFLAEQELFFAVLHLRSSSHAHDVFFPLLQRPGPTSEALPASHGLRKSLHPELELAGDADQGLAQVVAEVLGELLPIPDAVREQHPLDAGAAGGEGGGFGGAELAEVAEAVGGEVPGLAFAVAAALEAGGGEVDFPGEHEVTEDADAKLAGAAEGEAGFLAAALEFEDVVPAGLAADEEVAGDEPLGEADAGVIADEKVVDALLVADGLADAAEGEGDFFLVAELGLPFAVGFVGEVGFEAAAGDFFADGVEGVLEEFADGDDGLTVELLVGEDLEEALGIRPEGTVDVAVGVGLGLDAADEGWGEVPVAADGLAADFVLGGESFAEGGDAAQLVVDPVGELGDGVVETGAGWGGADEEAVALFVDGEVVVFEPVGEAGGLVLDAAVAEDDVGGALGVVFEDVGEAEEAGEVTEVDELGLGSGAEEGIELGPGEVIEALVMAFAQADEDGDGVGEVGEAALEVVAEVVAAPFVVAVANVVGGELVGEVEVVDAAGERQGDGAGGEVVDELLEGFLFGGAERAGLWVEEVAVMAGDLLALGAHADVVAVGGEEEEGELVVGDVSLDGGGEELGDALGDVEGVLVVVEGEVERAGAGVAEDGIKLAHPGA